MEDNTITDSASVDTGGQVINGVAVDDQGQAIPVPEDAASNESAVNAPSEELQTEEQPSTGADTAALPEVDDKLRKYAESQGFELDSPNAVKAAQAALKAQSEATRNSQRAYELEKASKITADQLPADIDSQTQDNVRLRNIELTMEAQRWKLANPDKLAHETAMAEVLQDPAKRAMVQEGYLSLDDVYKIARADTSDADLKSQGKREALESLHDKQQATVPRGNAVNSVPVQAETITPQNVDALVGQHDLAWFNKNREAINKAMAGH